MSEIDSNVIERPSQEQRQETRFANQMAMLKKHLLSTPEIDRAKIAAVKEDLAQGRYRILSDQIATKMYNDIEMA